MIGIVNSHGKEGFSFITKRRLRSGEFICYLDPGIDREILCRVRHVEPLQEYPRDFLLDIEIDPEQVSEFYGLDIADFKYFKAWASVIGYYDKSIGEFINPRTKPPTGIRILEAGMNILKDISRANKGEVGSAYLGKILGTGHDVVLSVRDIISQHLSIIAATGAGKSYTVGVLVEELLLPFNMAPVLIFDPHGEYQTLAEICNDRRFWGNNYRPRVRIVKPKDIKIRFSDLSLGDIISIMDDGTMSDKMKTLFRGSYYNLKNSKTRQLTRNEVKIEIESHRDPTNEPTIEGILWRFGKLYAPIFDDFQSIPLVEYFKVGQLTILDVSGIEEAYQQLIASVLLRRLFDAREGTENNRYNESHGDKFLPYPVFVVLEEAHRFAPQTGEAKSKTILKTILSEGRKFGIGICLVSQRPSKLDSDSLSQCMTQITLRIINPTDQEQIAKSIESVSRDLIEELPGLAKGQAVISGVGINTPTLVKIRERHTSDLKSRSKDAPTIWQHQKRYEEENQRPPLKADVDFDIGV